MSIKINQAIEAYIAMRDSINERTREAKEYAASLKGKMDKLELHIHSLLIELGSESFMAKGVGTAFITTKDSVSIKDKEGFKKFLASQMLTNLQGYLYRRQDGEWQPEGEADLEEHVEKLLNSGAFDLLTVSANKNNCKTYMSEHDGLMPEGIDYFKETVVQFRK